jgi:hypothetical protein
MVTGGAAFVSNKTSIPFTGISIGGEDARVGWTVGAGLDYAFANNWFAGVEYRYSQYQAKTFVYPIPILNLGLVGFRQELTSNQVTAPSATSSDVCRNRIIVAFDLAVSCCWAAVSYWHETDVAVAGVDVCFVG